MVGKVNDGMLSEVFHELSVPHTCVLSEVFSNLEHMYKGAAVAAPVIL
jgi:hypothetical protein